MSTLDTGPFLSWRSVLILMLWSTQDRLSSPIPFATPVQAWVPSLAITSTLPHRHRSIALGSPLFATGSEYDYDLAVIGGGVVGVQAALCAASAPYSRRVCLIDAPREASVLMVDDEDLSIGAPTGLFSKALRDTSKRIKVATLRGMGLREDRYVEPREICISARRMMFAKGVTVTHFFWLLSPTTICNYWLPQHLE
jgi:hypothetical protein